MATWNWSASATRPNGPPASAGVEVVDVEWKIGKQRFLRVYIDKPEGVSHRDCQAVSEQLGVLLDVEDLVPGSALRSGSQLAGS